MTEGGYDVMTALSALNFAARMLVHELDAHRLVDHALDTFVDFGRGRRVALLDLAEDGQTAEVGGVLSPASFVDPDQVVPVADTLLSEVVRTKKPHTWPAAADSGLPLPFAGPGSESPDGLQCLCLPLVDSRGVVIGLVTLERPATDPLLPEEVQALGVVCTLAAVAMENAKLFALATTDGLTGLYVRRFFEIRLREELTRARRHPGPVSLIMTDIDHFKRFNDTYGHQQGDEILRGLADVFRSTIRRDLDVPCRYGGEEFIIILPATNLEGACLLAERLRQSCEAKAYAGPSGRPLKVTISAGVASTQGPETLSFDELVSRADQMLYKAKESGRNRVVEWDEA